jgi:protein gp37
MSDSAIGWTDKVWNPVIGCAKVSAGCKHCYAETVAAGQPRKLAEPLRWRAPQRVFVNSMSDLFHEDVPFEYIAAVFGVMAAAPRHTFQVLTKRPARMLEFFAWLTARAERLQRSVFPEDSAEWVSRQQIHAAALQAGVDPYKGGERSGAMGEIWPLPNVWLGVSVEDQAAADERIPLLLQALAAIRFISAEPLLGPINLRRLGNGGDALWPKQGGLDWAIIGGESGPGHRPAEVEWIESLTDQCLAAGVPPFVKQDSGPKAGQRGRLSERLWALKQHPEVRRG